MPTKNVCITLSPEAQEELKVKCKKLGMTRSAFIEFAIAQDFTRLEPTKANALRAEIIARRTIGAPSGNPAEAVTDYFLNDKDSSGAVDDEKIMDEIINDSPINRKEKSVTEKKEIDEVISKAAMLPPKPTAAVIEKVEKPADVRSKESSREEKTERIGVASDDEPKDFLKPQRKKNRPSMTI